MNSTINFHLKQTDGSVQMLTASLLSTLIEVVGANALRNSQVLLDGQPVNYFMTLQHENITDGSVLYVIKKAAPGRRKRSTNRSILEWITTQEFEEEERRAQKDLEQARICDVIWSGGKYRVGMIECAQ
jgi:hypothetical protein